MSGVLDGIDLADPDNYVGAVPFGWFDRLREEAPVVWHPEAAPNAGFWAVTRYDDLTAVHMDWQTYSSEVGAVSLEELDPEQLAIRKSMLETDPPRHTDLRKVCSKKFSARGVGRYEDWIREVASGVLDRALPLGEFDFVSEISRELPIRFLCSIFTVPQSDAPELIKWGDEMIGNQDPDTAAVVIDKEDTEPYRLLPFRSPTAIDVFAYADRKRDERLAEPSDDVINALTLAQAEGILDEGEYHNYFALLMIAGNETTRHTISHGMLALMENPDQLQLLKDDPSLIPNADGGDPALGHARLPFPPHGHPRCGAARPADPRGRQGRHVVHQREPRPGDLPRPLPVRRHADTERPRDVRAGRTALLPRSPPRPARDEDPLPGAPAAPRHDRVDRAGGAPAIQLRERHQAHARAGADDVAALRGRMCSRAGPRSGAWPPRRGG